jgi:hypothetical protein
VGTPFQTAFYEYNEWYPPLAPSITMISVTPPAGERAGIVEALSAVKQRERARAEAATPPP